MEILSGLRKIYFAARQIYSGPNRPRPVLDLFCRKKASIINTKVIKKRIVCLYVCGMEKKNIESRLSKRKTGRLPGNERKVCVYLPVEEFKALRALLPATNLQLVTEMCRHILSGKSIVAHYYGKNGDGRDGLLDEVSALLTNVEVYSGSIRRLARSYYQHSSFDTRLSYYKTAIDIYKEVDALVPALYERVRKVTERWL